MFKGLFRRSDDGDELTGPDLHRLLREPKPPLILDVREPAEHAQGVIPGSRRLPLGRLGQQLHQLPRERDIVVVCRSGSRSRIATQLLRRNGFARVRNLRGGLMLYPGPLTL